MGTYFMQEGNMLSASARVFPMQLLSFSQSYFTPGPKHCAVDVWMCSSRGRASREGKLQEEL